jgi:hypothetical protein
MRADIMGNRRQNLYESRCSQMPKAVMRQLPNASPALFCVRRAEGRERNISAAADAIENGEKKIAW